MIPAFSTAKLIGIGVGALALIAIVWTVLGWRSERNQLRQWQSDVVAATRDASGNPKLAKSEVAKQVRFMGEAINLLHGAIEKQNGEVARLGNETKRQQNAATEALQRAEKRSSGVLGVSERLAASSRAGERQAKPCEPSKELTGAWR
jgi:hypothetical protein